MKVLAIIFSSVFFVAIIGFAVSAAMTGFSIEHGLSMGWYGDNFAPYDLSEVFTEQYDNIEVSVVSSRVDVRISSVNETKVAYKNNNPNIEFTADIINNTLVIREKVHVGFNFFSITGGGHSALDIEIPFKTYNNITLNTVSGKVNAALPECRSLTANTTSGQVNIHTYGTDSFDFSSTSGHLIANGLSGNGRVSLISGKAELYYDEWNGGLGIDLISGKAYVALPAGSGADLSFDRVSGSLSYSLDGDEGRPKSGDYSIGGYNKQRVTVDVISGKVELAN